MSTCDGGQRIRGATVALLIALLILVIVAAVVFYHLDRPDMLIIYLVHSLAALVVLAVLAFLGYYMFSKDARSSLLAGNGARVATPVVVGIIDMTSPPVFDTQNSLLPNYLPLKRSFNRLGGAELSYAFWVYKQNNIATTESSTTSMLDDGLSASDIVLLVKGDLRTAKTVGQSGRAMSDVVVKAPLIKFDTSTDRLTVEFNTSDPLHVNGVVEGTVAPSPAYAPRPTVASFASKVSIFGLNDPKFNARWFHVAVVLKDNDPSGRMDRNIHARIFVNGESVFDKNVVGDLAGSGATLRQNNGFLHLLPKVSFTDAAGAAVNTVDASSKVDGSPTGALAATGTGTHALNVKLADVFHYNYALDDADVLRLHARGVTKQEAVVKSSVSSDDQLKYKLSDPNAWRRVRD